MYLTKILLSSASVITLGTPGNPRDEQQDLCQSSWMAPLPTWHLSSDGSRVWSYTSDNMKSDPFINDRAELSRTDRPFMSAKRWTEGMTKIPLRRRIWVCSIKDSHRGPRNHSCFSLDIFQSRWYHRLASVIKKSQLSSHKMFDFTLCNFLATPPRKIVVKCTPNESTSFTWL